jgi:16S rRNA (uracil1498-N3)-methyltransferase
MHRFYVPNLNAPGLDAGDGTIRLDGPVARQLTTVLRAVTGDRIRLFDGTGLEWEAEIDHAGRGEVSARLIGAVEPVPEPSIKVTMLLGLARPERIELAVQKCTELGAAGFVPVMSERVQGGTTGSPSASRLERWQRIATEAAEQSGRATVPGIAAPLPVMDAVPGQLGDRPLLCMWEERGSQSLPLRDALEKLKTREGDELESTGLGVLIGPPGGFSEQEATAIHDAGAELVTLGPRVLRSETAAITVMSAILYEMGDLGDLRG